MNKNQITIQLRPLVMAGLHAEAGRWGMPVKEFLEQTLTMARMHPQGVQLKLPEVLPNPAPEPVGDDQPLLIAIGGG